MSLDSKKFLIICKQDVLNRLPVADLETVLRIRIRDPGLGAFLTPGSGMGESQHPDPGPGMNNRDHIFRAENPFFCFFRG